MRWAFRRGMGLASWAIGYFGSGYYSHVDVITPSGKMRGARSDVITTRGTVVPSGYYDRPFDYEVPFVLDIFEMDIPDSQERLYWQFSDRQLGKPYDSRGIWGIALGRRDWRQTDSWFCSEEVAANCEFASIIRPLWSGYNSIDPGEMALILSSHGAKLTRLVGPRLGDSRI